MRRQRRDRQVNRADIQRQHRVRLGVLYGGVFLAMSSLIVRLGEVQVVQGAAYRASERVIHYARIPVLPQRGWIYDANGQVLAWDVPVVKIELVRSRPLSSATLRREAQILAPVLETTPAALYHRMTSNPSALQVTLATHVSDAQVAFVVEHQAELPGIQVIQDYERQYPYGDLAGQVLGYVGAITAQNVGQYPGYLDNQQVGETGIEYEYEHLLQGKPGYRLVAINSTGAGLGVMKEVRPVGGDNIQLTLDGREQAVTQEIIQQMLASSPHQHITDVAAVMLNVRTGGVIAMASYPYLDPNWYVNGSYVQHAHYLETSGAQMNYAIQAINYPGSTVKPANLIAAMNAGVVNPQTRIFDNGYIYVGTQIIHEDGGIAFGWVNPVEALTVSSDVFMYEVGLRLGKWLGSSDTSGGTYPASAGSYQNYLDTDFAKGINQIFQEEEDFGLGPKTGIDLPYEVPGEFFIEDYRKGNIQVPYNLQASEASLRKTGKYVNYGSPASLADADIGQSQMFSPIQLAVYAMTLADQGIRLKPHLLERVYAPNATPSNGAKPIFTYKPQVAGVVKAKLWEWNLVKQGMHGVTSNPAGTAYYAFLGAPYQAAGKTGTAQIVMDGRRTDNSVFICYAPLNHPLVAVAVMAPGGGYGAQFSAIIARKMIDAYFDEHHEPWMPKSQWTSTRIPSSWFSSPAYLLPEKSH
ncbi:peptidoglycan D,D-transpeptidase FtsI family protein [Alicyclobacillus acidocaldarius]|uniref:Peptidoglycan glycosyltransferase n=1 Tax=Alicyclobacillus acidocaldarius subsp. acidocaldarius (strain ATCC 27009 / DSM 446 / BCRC 14685 / JCM 5260 / KCTC 1825 / NBRC 15652 / NCIMB 11725 / NRRL B-14509 / 104-IA) TaxID=521098 RepID=C8WRE8_ALIAD|nr:penicillin-binding transpeptidase domain-containing protein [Alicyclobacillus acidocaldarius]ACV57353.1 Peptidoglycan glycosyltransferase [Alicyclobacillus acidocaldarius subsp. acidocaldarius DSM 446]